MNVDRNDETTQNADGGWWISVKGDHDSRDALGPFVSEDEVKRIAGLLFARAASPELS